jgi:hypothetical protein
MGMKKTACNMGKQASPKKGGSKLPHSKDCLAEGEAIKGRTIASYIVHDPKWSKSGWGIFKLRINKAEWRRAVAAFAVAAGLESRVRGEGGGR